MVQISKSAWKQSKDKVEIMCTHSAQIKLHKLKKINDEPFHRHLNFMNLQ